MTIISSVILIPLMSFYIIVLQLIMMMRSFLIEALSDIFYGLLVSLILIIIGRRLAYLFLTLLLLSKIEIFLLIFINIIFAIFFIIFNFFIKWRFSCILLIFWANIIIYTILLVTFFSMLFHKRTLSKLIY
jgi:hypothetical protein